MKEWTVSAAERAYYGQPYAPGNAKYERDRIEYESWVKIHNSPERQAELRADYPTGGVRLLPWYFHEHLEEEFKKMQELARN